MKPLLILLFLISFELFAGTSTIIKLEIKGAIGPASSSYLKEGMSHAISKNASMLLIELDTPGGPSTSMREMIQEITNSSIPVITYVYPKGARAASAGTYILYASHVAVMAPGTNLGAATPISLMPAPKIADSNISATSTLEKKVINDAMAYIKSLAELNDRNITWALSAVKDAKSLSAKDALKYGVIDFIAEDTEELLSKLDGRKVTMSGESIILKTQGVVIELFEANWKTRFLSIITNPNIAYIAIPTRPPAEKWVKPACEQSINTAYQMFIKKLDKVEYLLGYEGNAFAFTGNAEDDLLSITSVHPMREDAINEFLLKSNTDAYLIKRLIIEGKLVETEYNGKKFYTRRLSGQN